MEGSVTLSGELLPALLAFFAGLAAASLVVMACLVYSMWRTVRSLNERATEFMNRWRPVADTTEQAVTEFSEQSSELLARLNTLSALLHKQALKADSVLGDIVQTAQRNIEHVDSTLRKTLERIEAVSAALEQAVRVPVAQARAAAVGISAAWRHYTHARRRDPGRVAADEELFI